jgi:hypothetical protein
MNTLQKIIFCLFLSGSINLWAQKSACYEKELFGFIKDGQDYSLTLENSNKGSVYLSFFEGFEYRITICSSNTKNFKIALYDIEKKLLFSGNCENFMKSIDLKFKSNIACIAEISTADATVNKPEFTIAIGFKQSQGTKKD